MYQVDNAVIMAAGASSRFAPLSYEKPKALIEVKGEILIERQIRQLRAAGVPEIYVVAGYMAEQFSYLEEKFGVHILMNPDYRIRNNHSSIYAARQVLGNTYICSADNYFPENPFAREVEESYYAAVYADGKTGEWCMQTDEAGYITRVDIGGENCWYMLGHTFWSETFSRRFVKILEEAYPRPETADKFWEDLFMENLSRLPMQIRKYPRDFIFEFDSIDELRTFDESYWADTRSTILKAIAAELGGEEREIFQIVSYKGADSTAAGFRFRFRDRRYDYAYEDRSLRYINAME